MSILRPYKRIYRPQLNPALSRAEEYLSDSRFIDKVELESLLNACHLVIVDLYKVFEYIEPCDDNLATYSHRIFELFLRCATEFETNCKGVLLANSYKVPAKDMNVKDFYKLEKVMKLSEYEIICDQWTSPHRFRPFEDWRKGFQLTWYQSYNQVKHNRSSSFALANFGNLMMSICGLVVVLAAQFDQGISKVASNWLSLTLNNMPNSFTVLPFTVIRPTFEENDKYSFDWEVLSKEVDPFDPYSF